MYFQSFPEAVRAETLITKFASDVKAFAKAHGGECILKPLQGSGGSGVFKVDSENMSNINQMIEAITRDGYIIAQAYVPAASKGDIRLFMMNGRAAADRQEICRAPPGQRQGRHPQQHPCRRQGGRGRDRRDGAPRSPS